MASSIERDRKSRNLIAEFPLAPINDEHAYSNAIAILDRLFDLGDRRTPAETEYFHALAMLACEYEEASINVKKGTSGPTYHGDSIDSVLTPFCSRGSGPAEFTSSEGPWVAIEGVTAPVTF